MRAKQLILFWDVNTLISSNDKLFFKFAETEIKREIVFKVIVKEKNDMLPTLILLPKRDRNKHLFYVETLQILLQIITESLRYRHI